MTSDSEERLTNNDEEKLIKENLTNNNLKSQVSFKKPTGKYKKIAEKYDKLLEEKENEYEDTDIIDKTNENDINNIDYADTNNKITKHDIEHIDKLIKAIMNTDNDSLESIYKIDYININRNFFINYLNPSLASTSFGQKYINIREFINSLTNFQYNPFEGIKSQLLHNMQTRLINIKLLSNVFTDNIDFIGEVDTNFRLDDLDLKFSKFIGSKEVKYTVLEHNILTSIMTKLIIALYSDVEYAFCQQRPTLTKSYKENIRQIGTVMEYSLSSSEDYNKSWSMFYHKLLDDKTIYKFNTIDELNSRLKDCIDKKFPIEIFCADIIKTFIPSIGFNYINVIKDIYLLGRLISIYLSERENKRNISVKDLCTIVHSITIDYETLYYSNAILPRTLPSNTNDMSEEFKVYYMCHTLTGPEYYILKQLELSIPLLKELI